MKMLPRIPFRLLQSLPKTTHRALSTAQRRLNAQPSSQQPSAYREGMSRYKIFASPFAKVFLGAVFTYQVIYWTWVKLEMEETKADRNQQVAALEKEARELTGVQRAQSQK